MSHDDLAGESDPGVKSEKSDSTGAAAQASADNDRQHHAGRHDESNRFSGSDTTRLSFAEWTQVVQSEAKFFDAEFTLRLLAWGLGVLLLVLVTALCKVLAPILKPLVLAGFLCYLIYPSIDWQRRRNVPGPLAYVLAFGGIALMFFGASRIIASNWRLFMRRLPAYKANMAEIDDTLTSFIVDLRLLPRDAQIEVLYADSLLDTIPTDAYTEFISNSTGFFLETFGATFVVAFFMVFILLEAARFVPRMESSFGPERGGRIVAMAGEINKHVQSYLRIKVLVSAMTAVLSGLIMYWFGLDFFATLALMVFVFNFIPYVGSIAATMVPFLIALVQFEDIWTALWMALALTLVQQLMGNLVEPRIQGRGLNVSPLLILASLAFFGWLWGVIGMLVSVPLISAIRLVLYEFEHTRPAAVLFSNLEDPEEFASQ